MPPICTLLQEQLARTAVDHIAVIPFLKRAALTDVLEEARYAVGLRLSPLDGALPSVRGAVSRTLRSGRMIRAQFIAWSPDEASGILATWAPSEPLQKAVSFLLSRCYPSATVPSLPSAYLCRIITSVQEHHEWTIENRLSVAYPRGQGGPRMERKRMSFTELLQELSDHDRVLDSIRFACFTDGNQLVMEAYLSRRGILKLYEGEFDAFMRVFVEPVREQARARHREMSGRAKTSGARYGSPVTIQFPTALLAERAELERLCDVLSRMQDTSICVFHLNPHLHLAVLDYADASGLDVFMTGPNTLRVIPGYRTSEASLLRVCGTIMTEYAEGTIAQ